MNELPPEVTAYLAFHQDIQSIAVPPREIPYLIGSSRLRLREDASTSPGCGRFTA